MLHSLLALAAFAILVLAAFGLGRPVVRGLRLENDDALATAVWSIGLGMVAAGLVLVVLGLCGLLYEPLVSVLTTAAAFWGAGQVLRARLEADPEFADHGASFETLEPAAPAEPDAEPAPPRWVLRGMFWAAGLAAAGSLVAALAPPTAGDALCYHLELPKQFLARHSLVFLPYHDNSTFPLLAEMWYVWGLALHGGECAQLVHWGLGVLLALAAVVLATPILGRPWAWMAGGLVLLTPGVNNQMTAPLNDVALAAMTTLALAAWWKAAILGEGRRWFLVAGVMLGAALGTKYVALLFVVALAVPWMWLVVKRPKYRRVLLEGATVMAVAAASVGGVWYVRAAWHRGNPVYPFLSELKVAVSLRETKAHLAERDDYVRETLPASKSPLGRSPLALFSAPWQVTMQPDRFGGRGHQLGLLPLAVLPGLVFCRRLRGLGLLLAVAAAYSGVWFLLRQNVRFLFPAIPLFAVGIAWVWVEVQRFPLGARRVAAAVFAMIVLLFGGVGLHRAADKAAVAVGLRDRESYLIHHDPTYPAAAVLERFGRDDVHLLTQDYRTYRFQNDVTRENVYRRETGYHRRVSKTQPLSRVLKSAGFTHLLLAETTGGDPMHYAPTLSRLAEAELAEGPDAGLRVLSNYEHHSPDGLARHYRLVELR